jgi:hypothetical protein
LEAVGCIFFFVNIKELLGWRKLTLTANLPRFSEACAAEALRQIITTQRSNWTSYKDECDASIMQGLCNYLLSECRCTHHKGLSREGAAQWLKKQ